jgi:tRNA-dihydrouridine synthase B
MEFLSSEALTRGNERTLEMLQFCDEERPISIQIYGSDPERMADAARRVEASGADACDINMGCPANKVLRGCAGCALMGDLDLARRIVATVRKAIRIPLTVKFRAGLRENDLNYLELGRICEGEGVDGVALHPRTAKQMYRGEVDWSRIVRLRETLGIPVIGNGDVTTAEDALRMFAETGCAGVMIGRASMRNPWIYRQTAELMAGRRPYEPVLEDRRRLILEHFQLLVEQEETQHALHKLRTFTGWYTRGIPGGRSLRVKINSLDTTDAFFEAVQDFFARAQAAA